MAPQSEAAFKAINSAYTALSNPQSRKLYDECRIEAEKRKYQQALLLKNLIAVNFYRTVNPSFEQYNLFNTK